MNFLGLLVDGVSSPVALKSLDGLYVFGNAALEEALGVPQGRIVGSDDSAWMSAADAAAFAARERAVATTGNSIHSFEEYGPASHRRTFASTRFPGRVIGTGLVGVDIDRSSAATDGPSRRERAQSTIATLQHAVAAMKSKVPKDTRQTTIDQSRIRELALWEFQRMQRYGHPVSIVVIHLDDVSQSEGTRDLAEGEQIVRQAGDILRGRIRTTDAISRWGVDEYLVVLTNTSISGAGIFADRLRAALVEHDFPTADRVAASVAVAEARSKESFDDWIARAESGLRLAKANARTGRDARTSRTGQSDADFRVQSDETADSVTARHQLLLEWRPECESGNVVIDAEHQSLFAHAAALSAAAGDSAQNGAVGDQVNDLIAHLAAHFAEEESMFRAAGYLGADSHTQIHRHLLNRARALMASHAAGDATISEVVDFLISKVIVRHLLIEDTKYFPYLELLQLAVTSRTAVCV
jgi:hemerythrin-like metal-binding protein/diguanylate cyclase (GGDEF)-like protein